MNKIEIKDLDLYYGDFHALKNINLEIPEKQITSFIGPSGCGKSTLLKSINRMNDLVEGCRITGQILLRQEELIKIRDRYNESGDCEGHNSCDGYNASEGQLEKLNKLNSFNILDKGCDVNLLRKNVGMVFQKPNPFPMSIYDNIAYGPRTHGIKKRAELDQIVEEALRNAAIWDEFKDNLKKSALELSGGQQQRLCPEC